MDYKKPVFWVVVVVVAVVAVAVSLLTKTGAKNNDASGDFMVFLEKKIAKQHETKLTTGNYAWLLLMKI